MVCEEFPFVIRSTYNKLDETFTGPIRCIVLLIKLENILVLILLSYLYYIIIYIIFFIYIILLVRLY